MNDFLILAKGFGMITTVKKDAGDGTEIALSVPGIAFGPTEFSESAETRGISLAGKKGAYKGKQGKKGFYVLAKGDERAKALSNILGYPDAE